MSDEQQQQGDLTERTPTKRASSAQRPLPSPADDFERRRKMSQQWHYAVNTLHDGKVGKAGEWRSWMYEAMTVFQEVPRLALILGNERRGELSKLHRQCSHSPTEPVPDNHLTCCLGVECRKCPELLALETAKLPPEEIDEAKAWTCATHILMSGGDPAKEGYLMTTDDRMFWDRTYQNMAAEDFAPD